MNFNKRVEEDGSLVLPGEERRGFRCLACGSNQLVVNITRQGISLGCAVCPNVLAVEPLQTGEGEKGGGSSGV